MWGADITQIRFWPRNPKEESQFITMQWGLFYSVAKLFQVCVTGSWNIQNGLIVSKETFQFSVFFFVQDLASVFACVPQAPHPNRGPYIFVCDIWEKLSNYAWILFTFMFPTSGRTFLTFLSTNHPTSVSILSYRLFRHVYEWRPNASLGCVFIWLLWCNPFLRLQTR